MADLAAALIVGCALLGLIYWYFRSDDDERAPATSGRSATPSAPPADVEGDKEAPDTPDRVSEPPLPDRASIPGVAAQAERPSGSGGASAGSRTPEPYDDNDDLNDDDITLVTLAPTAEMLRMSVSRSSSPSYGGEEEDEETEDQDIEEPSAVPIIYDDDAAVDEPTSSSPLLLISAVGQTDTGQRRKKNEDCYLCLDDYHLFAVADGMGGHAGGEVASRLAVDTLERTFREGSFTADNAYPDVPRRGSELAVAIQSANLAVYKKAHADRNLNGMGTTVVSARFSPNKQRLYVGHVGDSRCYRLREKELTQLTTDHTMGAAGITGPMANHLSRAVGISPAVKIDLIIARPHPGDVYLLCSDGLSKMTSNDEIREVLLAQPEPEKAAKSLIEKANESGGRDNITVILVRVSDPKDLAQFVHRAP